MGYPTRPTQPFIHPGLMSSNPCNYMNYGVETIKRQSRAAYGSLVTGTCMDAGLDCAAYRLHARSISGTKTPQQLQVCSLWRYISVLCPMPLPLLYRLGNLS